MIPADIDPVQLLNDLHAAGWKDHKIELALGYSVGYCAKMRAGPRPERPYQLIARLYNFWFDQTQGTATRQTVNTTTA